eukprot:CAMPEP_0117746320 /NCGR_PEP_ID=MMETSP0947-20121206/7877_1 /TAXON_ID=44440 /ORGANISM="Chattonella subsalsa, Strain CCMP2191" /LENGTH=464 /DNA_ID=CAMNT_0005563623 /DNA_START=64 /DNA_END=1458 /DNA_ORIENTATION=-
MESKEDGKESKVDDSPKEISKKEISEKESADETIKRKIEKSKAKSKTKKENGDENGLDTEKSKSKRDSTKAKKSSKKKTLPPGTDLWTRITHEVNEKKKEGTEQQQMESYGLLLGERGVGKSSLVQSFLNPNKVDDKPKPTVALEYQFARRSGGGSAKDIAHLWELGGGMKSTTELIRVAISPKQFQFSTVFVVIDLSQPENAFGSLLHWMNVARRHMGDCMKLIAKKKPPLAEAIRKKMVQRLAMADDNPDKRLIDPAPIPLVVVGNKYDLFKDHESVKRKALFQALRFVAHLNGATFLTCSTKEKNLRDVFRIYANSYLFRVSPKKIVEANGEKAVIMPAGQDSMSAILRNLPNRLNEGDFVSTAGVSSDATAKWKQVLQGMFGPPTDADMGRDDDDGEEEEKGNEPNSHPEPLVDEMRAQRDQALKQYRKEVERRIKMEKSQKEAAMAKRQAPKDKKSSRK